MKAEIERLTAENAELAKKRQIKPTLKVSAKGALSLYGFGRFPVTFYKETWLKLLGMSEEISAFIKANDAVLHNKSDKPKVVVEVKK